jgi:hypothetical protein
MFDLQSNELQATFLKLLLLPGQQQETISRHRRFVVFVTRPSLNF